METNLSPIIKAISEVNDNIWLGDLEKAIEVAEKNLHETAKIANNAIEASRKTKKILKENRQLAHQSNKQAIEDRFWVAEHVAKTIKDQNIDSRLNLYGVLLNQLSDLKDSLNYLISAKSQTTLDIKKEKQSKNNLEILQGQDYRYSIQRYPNRWDIRILLEKSSTTLIDRDKLRALLSNQGYSAVERYTKELVTNLDLFSQEMFAQVLMQDNQISISMVIGENLIIKEKVDEIVKNIISVIS
jgi:hypothetical protein